MCIRDSSCCETGADFFVSLYRAVFTLKLLWRRAGRLITEAMRGQTARLNATVAAEADFGNTDSQSCTALAGCERRRIFGFCSAADQSARHRPFFRFFSRAAATSGPCFPPRGCASSLLVFHFCATARPVAPAHAATGEARTTIAGTASRAFSTESLRGR